VLKTVSANCFVVLAPYLNLSSRLRSQFMSAVTCPGFPPQWLFYSAINQEQQAASSEVETVSHK
jgi:hypothetical protein